VVDDHTRLDFTVPRSPDSYFGIGNYNTGYWLVPFMQPGFRLIALPERWRDKLTRLGALVRPVLPHLSGIEEAGFDRAEVRRRIHGARLRRFGDARAPGGRLGKTGSWRPVRGAGRRAESEESGAEASP
jgi:hypothetical protein